MTADLLALVARGMIAASFALVFVLALRGPIRGRFGARIAYALWLVVPGTVVASYLPARTVLAPAPMPTVAPVSDAAGAIGGAEPAMVEMAGDGSTWFDPAQALLWLWLAGFGLSLALVLIDQRRAVRRLGLTRDGDLYRASGTDAGPAVVGIFAPRIVVPADFEQRYDSLERTLVLAHERCHLRRGDAQVNALAALAQCLNWFNPLFYVARRALRVDQELACDERVLGRHGDARRAYAEAMLKTQLASRALPLGCYWPALGAKPLKQRIAMLSRPAPTRAMRLLGTLACAGLVGAGGATAWAVQPPQIAYAQNSEASNRDRVLGAELLEAIRDGRTDEARALITRGAHVNARLLGDGTPLIAAANRGDAGLVRLLVGAGADVNGAAPGDGNPLIVASHKGHVEIMSLLIEAGAEVNAQVRGDETPLINSARENRIDAARLLLDRGADVNLAVEAPTLYGVERRSPLGMARRSGHDEMVRLLLSRGARI